MAKKSTEVMENKKEKGTAVAHEPKGEDIHTLVKIKEAEAESERKLVATNDDAAAIVEKAKKEAERMEAAAKEKGEDEYYDIVAAAEKEASRKRESMIGAAKKNAAAVKAVDKAASMRIFKKLVTDKFGV